MKTNKVLSVSILLLVMVILFAGITTIPADALAKINTPSSGMAAPMSVVLPAVSYSAANITSPNYSCKLTAQTPADWVKMVRRQSFDAYWTVQNTGAVWNSSSTRFVYLGGTKFQTHGDSFYIGKNVGLGSKIKLGVDMMAPKTPGTYSTTWALKSGNTTFCRVTLIVTVK
ncbi:MAG: NBR1-Ig-like domain-containing protein [Chloroflexota bacterium]